MAKFISRPIGGKKRPASMLKSAELETAVLKQRIINKGMISSIDSADIPPDSLAIAKDCRSRFDRMEVRPGTVKLLPIAPNTNLVLEYYNFRRFDGQNFTMRFTRNSIHERGAISWINYPAGVGGTLTGSDFDRFDVITAFNRLFFANGVNPIQEIDSTAKTYIGFGNAPTYKYITAFADRIFGANLVASTLGSDSPPNPVQVGWGGVQGSVGGIDEWDPAVEETAGSQPLLESPGDLDDEITGLFAFTNYLAVLRERSIWLGTKQAIPTQPVRFFAAFPGFGCDCPSSAQVCMQSLIWLDTRTRTVWQYEPNGAPVPIGRNIEEDILASLSDPSQVFSGYNPIENEYYIGYQLQSTDYSRIWVYNLRTQSWTYDEVPRVTCIADLELGIGGTTIDELSGVINDLMGNINGLSGFNPSVQTHMYGRNDGEGAVEDITTASDYFRTTIFDLFVVYQPEMVSKDFDFQSDDASVVQVRVELFGVIGGDFKVYYRKNNLDWVEYRVNNNVIAVPDMRRPRVFLFKKHVRARRFAFMVRGFGASYRLLSYELHYASGGMSRHNLGVTTT